MRPSDASVPSEPIAALADGGPDAAIVIFGAAVRPGGRPSGALRSRVAAAFACGQGLRNPIYLPTGAKGRFGPAEATVMAGLLRDFGVPEGRIIPEPTGTDTLSSVRAVARLLRGRGITLPVYAATSDYHLARCVLLLRLAGLSARVCPPPVPASQTGWRRLYWRLREVPAVPYDAAILLALRLAGRL